MIYNETAKIVISRQGLRLTEKQRVSGWELVEGARNPAPLSWAWFSATKVERKPLTYENAHRYECALHKQTTHLLIWQCSFNSCLYAPLTFDVNL